MPKKKKVRRKLIGLKWASLEPNRPSFIPTSKNTNWSIKRGLNYEKKVAKYLQARFGEDKVLHGPWIRYEDSLGYGWAQPDIVILPSEGQVFTIGECKYTYTPLAAYLKLKNIYLPLCHRVWSKYKDMRTVQICHTLSMKAKGKNGVSDIDNVLSNELEYKFSFWNFRPL